MTRRRSTIVTARRWNRTAGIALGDARALQTGRVGQRITNRIVGRILGRIMRNVWR